MNEFRLTYLNGKNEEEIYELNLNKTYEELEYEIKNYDAILILPYNFFTKNIIKLEEIVKEKKKQIAGFDTVNKGKEQKKTDGKKYNQKKNYNTGRKK